MKKVLHGNPCPALCSWLWLTSASAPRSVHILFQINGEHGACWESRTLLTSGSFEMWSMKNPFDAKRVCFIWHLSDGLTSTLWFLCNSAGAWRLLSGPQSPPLPTLPEQWFPTSYSDVRSAVSCCGGGDWCWGGFPNSDAAIMVP